MKKLEQMKLVCFRAFMPCGQEMYQAYSTVSSRSPHVLFKSNLNFGVPRHYHSAARKQISCRISQ